MSEVVERTAVDAKFDPDVLVDAGGLRGWEHHRHEDAARDRAPAHQAVTPNGIPMWVITTGQEDMRELLADNHRFRRQADLRPARRRLASAAGALTRLTGSMCFDDLLHHLAQRYHRVALPLLDEAGDTSTRWSARDACARPCTRSERGCSRTGATPSSTGRCGGRSV